LHREVDGVGVVRALARRTQSFGPDELDAERIGEARNNIDLQLTQLVTLAVESASDGKGAQTPRDLGASAAGITSPGTMLSALTAAIAAGVSA
jgi:hypothetical protein